MSDLEKRLAELVAESGGLERKSGGISGLRGVTFLLTAAGALYGSIRSLPPLGWALVAASGAAFVGLVVAHAVLISRATEKTERAAVIRRWLDRLADVQQTSPDTGERFLEPGHVYARDLDVFAPASAAAADKEKEKEPRKGWTSLFQLVSDARTPAGEAKLASWLSAPATLEDVAARQEAARELAPRTGLREDLAVLGKRAAAQVEEARGRWAKDAPDPLLAWAGAGDVSAPAPALVWTGAALVALTLALFTLSRIVPAEQLGLARHAWLIPLVAQLLVLAAARSAIERTVGIVASREAPFGRFRPLFARLEDEPLEAQRSRAQLEVLRGSSGHDASNEMRALDRLTGFAELRHNALVYFFFNTITLWDLWCAVALARWQKRAGRRVASWIAAVGEIEALASLGALAHARPSWAWPEVAGHDARFEAEGLGHPLIPAERRVVNDVAIQPAGTALLVTGSNMSGKSTMLRSMGVAAVLAQAGAPVCATRLRMSSLAVRTSMRVDDSLERGVSHFYAELERLKLVAEGAEGADGAPPLLFLLDEILHGTNSRERHLGATAVVRHLLDKGAIGAVSTHDLGLVELERESGGRIQLRHFEELVEDGKMTFDYKLKPGVVTTTNALRLMRMVGLPV